MPKEMEVEEGEMPADMLNSLRVTSFDEENDNGVELDENDVIDDEDEDEDDDGEPVVLGIVEKPRNSWSLLRQFFPSKAGGAPAWLDPDSLPSERAHYCDFCEEPLQFLLQVYAPLSERDSTFHRTLYLFMCKNMSCLKEHHEKASRRCVKVFRCQLPRSNAFYSSDPPRHDGSHKPLSNGDEAPSFRLTCTTLATLCSWCATWRGDIVCGNCKLRYCSKKHKDAHLESSDCSPIKGKKLWPEHEIINEEESEYDDESSDDTCNAKSVVPSSRVDKSTETLMKGFEGDEEKRSCASFQIRVSKAPKQVLRYRDRDVRANPLWPVSSGRASMNDIPKCNYCGGPRCFEFQVLPQLLYYFGVKNDVNSLDWATIVVYTCEVSCDASMAYKEEFAWVQLSKFRLCD